MGAIAQQAQGRQMVEMTPKKNLQMLMKKSWPRIASVVGNNISPDRLYQMCVSAINKTPKLAECSPQSVLSCFMTCSALGLEHPTWTDWDAPTCFPSTTKNPAAWNPRSSWAIAA